MNEPNSPVEVTLRIPGAWAHPGELLERLPEGYHLTPESLQLPDGGEIEFNPVPPDNQFAQIFASSCRQPATAEEMEVVNRYSVNICLTGPGGSLEAARKMLEAGAAIIRAGGAGVFIDNCGLAHGGAAWIEMADDGGPDAVSYATVAIVDSQHELWTLGMHIMGLPEFILRRRDLESASETLVEVIRYAAANAAASDTAIDDGHALCDLDGIRYLAKKTTTDERLAGSPMDNPFGRLRLTSMQEIAEGN